MPTLPVKRWFVATVIPAFIAFAMVIGPDALNKVVSGGDPFDVFKDAFVQAFVLGPLIGASQAKALQGHTTRWKWWFVGNVTSWLFGAATIELAEWLLGRVASYPADSVSVAVSPACPLLAIAVHGLWKLWVTSPEATRDLVAAGSETRTRPGPERLSLRGVAACDPAMRELHELWPGSPGGGEPVGEGVVPATAATPSAERPSHRSDAAP